jgi:hypothetical protein
MEVAESGRCVRQASNQAEINTQTHVKVERLCDLGFAKAIFGFRKLVVLQELDSLAIELARELRVRRLPSRENVSTNPINGRGP